MWDIRTNKKYYDKLKKNVKRFEDMEVHLDENVEVPIIMIKTEDGKLSEFLRGFKLVFNFTKYGYNRIRKNCPLRYGKCIVEKCSWYLVKNFTGDCIKIWEYFK